MLAQCEKHFEAIEWKGTPGGVVKGPEKLESSWQVAGIIAPDEVDPLLEDCKSYLLKTARENGTTMLEGELPKPLRKQGCKGFVFSYTVAKERSGTIQVTATSTDQRKLTLKYDIEEDQYRQILPAIARMAGWLGSRGARVLLGLTLSLVVLALVLVWFMTSRYFDSDRGSKETDASFQKE